MYLFPQEEGNGPMKSIPQTSNSSTSKIEFRGISFLFEIFPVLWHLSQVFTNEGASLNKGRPIKS